MSEHNITKSLQQNYLIITITITIMNVILRVMLYTVRRMLCYNEFTNISTILEIITVIIIIADNGAVIYQQQ